MKIFEGYKFVVLTLNRVNDANSLYERIKEEISKVFGVELSKISGNQHGPKIKLQIYLDGEGLPFNLARIMLFKEYGSFCGVLEGRNKPITLKV